MINKRILLCFSLVFALLVLFAFGYSEYRLYADGEKAWWYMNIYGAEDEQEADIAYSDLFVSETKLTKLEDGLYEISFKLKNKSNYNIKICGVTYDVCDRYGKFHYNDFQFTERIKSGEEIVIKGEVVRSEVREKTVTISGFFADVDRDWKTWLYCCDEENMKAETVTFPDFINYK